MVRNIEIIKKNTNLIPPIQRTARPQIKKPNKKSSLTKWTDSEYGLLVQMVKQHGEDWQIIAAKFSNKTAKQCMQKFKNSQRSAKKGNWAEDEDEILLKWVKEFGPTKWTECSKLIKGRCGKQCRERWVNILNPHVKKGNWNDEEQRLIFENLHIHQTSWSSISKALPGRTENSIKNYFYSSVRRLKSSSLFVIIKEVYIDKLIDVRTAVDRNSFIREELSKLNTLSHRICSYLLSKDTRDEVFVQFLVNLLFCEEPMTKISSSVKQVPLLRSNLIRKPNDMSIYLPQEMSKHNYDRSDSKKNDTESVIGLLKNMANEVNKPDLLSVINFLENQLNTKDADTVIEHKNNNLMIRLPFCWNCKTKTCNLHRK